MPPPASLSTARLVGRRAIAFVLDMIAIARPSGDMLDPLIFLAIVQANVAHLMRDPGLQRTYGAYDSIPPDELRRPVSVNAIAHSLRLPYETVRRRVVGMAGQGRCVITKRGVHVPATVLQGQAHQAMLEASYRRMQAFYEELRAMGWPQGLPAPSAAVRDSVFQQPPIRAAIRINSDYVLRLVEMLTQHIGDVVSGVLWLAILRANTEHLSDAERGGDGADAASFVADEKRQPVRAPALAARLGLPPETVRRHVARMVREGRCVRGPQGLIVTAEILSRSHIVLLMGDNLSSLYRMFASLAQIGVIAHWDAQSPVR